MGFLLRFVIIITSVFICTKASAGSSLDMSIRLEANAAINNGIEYLLNLQQEDGAFSNHPGITAMAITVLAESPRNEEDRVKAAIEKGRTYILGKIGDDGRISRSRFDEDIYSLSVCLMALSSLKRIEDTVAIEKIRKYLINSQIKKGGDFGYGQSTFGYKISGYPDLSNTHWALEAIRLTQQGKPNAELANLWKRAELFVTSCQIVQSGDPKILGGFRYYPIGKEPEQTAHENTNVPWGSLTLGALKSLLFAGVGRDDQRIKNGITWVSLNTDLKKNTGLDQGGYYYYCYMYASAMLFLRQDELEAPDGKVTNWRLAMVEELLGRQKSGDHWQNADRLWMESDNSLCTAYALKAMMLALKE